jgi:hypothetical protein
VRNADVLACVNCSASFCHALFQFEARDAAEVARPENHHQSHREQEPRRRRVECREPRAGLRDELLVQEQQRLHDRETHAPKQVREHEHEDGLRALRMLRVGHRKPRSVGRAPPRAK